MIFIKQSSSCDRLLKDYDVELLEINNKLKMLESSISDMSIVQSGTFKEGNTSYKYFKYGNGIQVVSGNSTISREATKTTTVVSFSEAPFFDTGDMVILLTPQRNATLISKLFECDDVGNRVRTSSSFTVFSDGTISQYHTGFSFFVFGHWK